MLRHIIFTLTLVAHSSCMEMRETVERVVMVRTTGSDLQPAATGYIYEKKNDGQESVIEMRESDVVAHLSKLYERPKDFGASSGHHVDHREGDEVHTSSEERVIPVSENQEKPVDGTADVEFKKTFDVYEMKYDDSSAYDEYLRSLEDFRAGLYPKYDAGSTEDDKRYYKNLAYKKGNTGVYYDSKLKDFSGPESYEKVHEEHANKKYYSPVYYRGQKTNEQNTDSDKDDGTQRVHRVYDNSNNNHDYFHEGFKEFTDKYNEANGKGKDHKDSYESKHDREQPGRSGDLTGASGPDQSSKHSTEKVQKILHEDDEFLKKATENKRYGY